MITSFYTVMRVSPEAVAFASRSLTAVVGLFVAALAYRGYRRNDATRMLFLAVGIALLTAGVLVVAVPLDRLGATDGEVLLSRGVVTVVGLCSVLYAFVYD